MKHLRTALIFLMLLFAINALFSQYGWASQPLFANNLFTATPASISISYNTPFTINVTNLQNDSLWIFCLAQENISRVDAPTFYTLDANQTYEYQFISPNMTAVNGSDTSGYGYGYGNATATAYEIYFGAVNAQATSFQTSIIVLQMTTVSSLNALLQQLLVQNAQLNYEINTLIAKASYNNILIIATVASWIVWPCVILYMRLSVRRKSSLELSAQAEATAP